MKEEEEYLEWLKGQKQTLSKDKSIAVELVSFYLLFLLCTGLVQEQEHPEQETFIMTVLLN